MWTRIDYRESKALIQVPPPYTNFILCGIVNFYMWRGLQHEVIEIHIRDTMGFIAELKDYTFCHAK